MPEIERQKSAGEQVTFRADAAFAKPGIYKALEERSVDYVICIPRNKSLELGIENILFRPPGRPSLKPLVRYKSFPSREWPCSRRSSLNWSLIFVEAQDSDVSAVCVKVWRQDAETSKDN